MLDSLYFLAMLFGVVWLAWWATAGASGTNWSPFDMREATPREKLASTLRAGPRGLPADNSWRDRRGSAPANPRSEA